MRISLRISFLCFYMTNSLFCSTVTVSIRPYPHLRKTVHRLKKTGIIAHTNLTNLVNPSQVAGIFATYAGFLETSDTFGTIIFPRKQTNTTVHVLVTSHIKPIVMFEQTIAQWELEPGTPANFYLFNRVSDTDTGLTYWDVQEQPVPENNLIPIDTLIVIAHPKNIHIPIGITLSDAGPNLLLPTMYTRKGINVVDDALYVLDLSHLFGQVHLAHSKKPSSYAVQPKE
jgi:hypothetical protein